MKVFISWSGAVSRTVAELLRTYLPCMLQDVRPFVSSHDLASGTRWGVQLSKELDEAAFGIICLTPDNLHNDWILFEAGALTKHVEGRACCLLLQKLGPADVAGPLAQFQNRVFGRVEVAKLLADLNALLPAPIPESNLHLIFDKWWPDLDSSVRTAFEQIPATLQTAKRDPTEVFEEILLGVRRIQARLDRPAPTLSVNAVDISAASTLLEQGSDGDQYFTVAFSPLRTGASELIVRLDPYTTFQIFLDQMYKFLARYVPPFTYGTFWVFRDTETGAVISHERMRATGPERTHIKDHRKLAEVGIRAGAKLEAVRVSDLPAA